MMRIRIDDDDDDDNNNNDDDGGDANQACHENMDTLPDREFTSPCAANTRSPCTKTLVTVQAPTVATRSLVLLNTRRHRLPASATTSSSKAEQATLQGFFNTPTPTWRMKWPRRLNTLTRSLELSATATRLSPDMKHSASGHLS